MRLKPDHRLKPYVEGFQDAVAVVASGLPPEMRDSIRDIYIARGFTVADYAAVHGDISIS